MARFAILIWLITFPSKGWIDPSFQKINYIPVYSLIILNTFRAKFHRWPVLCVYSLLHKVHIPLFRLIGCTETKIHDILQSQEDMAYMPLNAHMLLFFSTSTSACPMTYGVGQMDILFFQSEWARNTMPASGWQEAGVIFKKPGASAKFY